MASSNSVMLPASYQVSIINPRTGQTSAVFRQDAFRQLRYSRVLNGVGRLAFTLDYGDASAGTYNDVFVLDAFAEVYRTDPVTRAMTKEDTYLVRSTHPYRDSDSDLYTVGAVSLNHLLMRRVVLPDDDPLQAGGYSTKNGVAGDVMRAYAREQLADLASSRRRIPGLTVPEATHQGQSVGARKRFENLFDVLTELSVRGEVDFQIVRTSGAAMELEIGEIGADQSKRTNYPMAPSLILSPLRGNLINPSLLLDRKDEKNVVFVLGKGQASGQVVMEMVGNGTADSPFNRIEFTANANSAEIGDSTTLLTAAVASLAEHAPKTEFEFDASAQLAGNIYRVDWTLGDTITAIWGSVEEDLRVKEVEIDLTPEGERLSVKVEQLPV